MSRFWRLAVGCLLLLVSTAQSQEGVLKIGHASGQFTYQFNGRPYHYDYRETYLARDALKMAGPETARVMLLWGQNTRFQMALFQRGMKRGLGSAWEKDREPLVAGMVCLPRIAVQPVEFAPCNDALDLTVLAGNIRVKHAAFAQPTGPPEQQATVLAERLQPDEQDRLLLVFLSLKALAGQPVSMLAAALRDRFPRSMTIVGIVGGTPVYNLEAIPEGIVACCLAGPLRVEVASVHPYEILAGPFRASVGESGRLRQLDGKPVQNVYAEHLVATYRALEKESVLRRFPLGLSQGKDWVPLQTLSPDKSGAMTTEPNLTEGSTVAILQQDGKATFSLLEQLAAQLQARAGKPGWALIVSNSAWWDGWSHSAAGYSTIAKAAGPDTAVSLIYPEDAFVVLPDGTWYRGLFNALLIHVMAVGAGEPKGAGV